MNLQTLSALVAGILTLGIGGSVFLRDRHTRRYLTFIVLCFNLSGWYLSHFFVHLIGDSVSQWLSLVFATAIPINAERFFRAFLAEDPRQPTTVSRPVVLATISFYLLLVVGLFYPLHRYWLFSLLLFVFVFGALGYCLYLILQRQRTITSRPEAIRLTYLLYGGLATIVLAAADLVTNISFALPTLGNILTVVYMYFFSQALFHYRLLDIKELLGKMITLALLVLTLTTIYGALLAWVGSDRPGLFFFNTLVASFFVLVLSEPLRHLVEDRVNRWLFAEKYAFSNQMRLLSRDLANIIEIQPLIKRIMSELENSGRVTHASILLARPTGTSYQLAGHIGPTPVDTLDITTRRLFFERLRNTEILSREMLERELDFQTASGRDAAMAATRNVIETLEELNAAVTIALTADDHLLGILNLRDERMREAYASDELEQLRGLAAQTAITLRNSEIYEQMKERDRLAALGQMAAGLAHELRNPLGAIKGAAQLLRTDAPIGDEPTHSHAVQASPKSTEDAAEYLDIIVEEVDRLDRVLSQFLGYAKPRPRRADPN